MVNLAAAATRLQDRLEELLCYISALAVAVMMKQRTIIFVTFGLALVSLVISAIAMAWIKMGDAAAIVSARTRSRSRVALAGRRLALALPAAELERDLDGGLLSARHDHARLDLQPPAHAGRPRRVRRLLDALEREGHRPPAAASAPTGLVVRG